MFLPKLLLMKKKKNNNKKCTRIKHGKCGRLEGKYEFVEKSSQKHRKDRKKLNFRNKC